MLSFIYSILEVQVRNIVAYVFIFWVGCSTNSNDTSSNSSSCVQDYAGHAQCKESNGDMFFCGNEGTCVEASGCEAEDCCVPGESGDNWCQSTFGSCNECLVTENDGMCSTNECTE